MRLASLLLAGASWLWAGPVSAQDPGALRFGRTYVKASINVEIKGFVQAGKGQRPILQVQEVPGAIQVWALDIGQDEKLKELLGRLDGKMAVVTGTCGLRTVGVWAPRETFGAFQPKEFTNRFVGTSIDFDRKVAVTSVKEVPGR